MIGQYLKIWNLRVQKNQNIEKITFKVVQIKFLAMHITNQKLSFDIFTVRNVQNIFMEHVLNILMIFGIKEKLIIMTHTMYCCLLLQIYLCYLWLLLCSRDTLCNAYEHVHVSTAHKPQILSPLRDLVLKCCWQTPDVIFEMSQLQNIPDLLITRRLERVQVHPQSSREEHWVLL